MCLRNFVRVSAHVSSTSWPLTSKTRIFRSEDIYFCLSVFLTVPHQSPLMPRRWAIESSPCLCSDVVNQPRTDELLLSFSFFASCAFCTRLWEFPKPTQLILWHTRNLVHLIVSCMNWSLHLDSIYERELPECKKNMLQITIGLFKHVL